MSYEGHGDGSQHTLGGGEIHEVRIAEVRVVAVGVVVPHVGGQIGVDVGVAEVGGEGQAENESSKHGDPTTPRPFRELRYHFQYHRQSVVTRSGSGNTDNM